MSFIKLLIGAAYPIADYATQNNFVIYLYGLTAEDVLEAMTAENLSEIQFMTDDGKVTGVYRDKLLCGYTVHGDELEIRIDDADLVRYGLTLDEDNRIVSAVPQRYAPDGAFIVDELPDGNPYDYLYINGDYIYDPLPAPEEPEPMPTQEERITALEEALNAIGEGIASV